jgi:hypothetical protein
MRHSLHAPAWTGTLPSVAAVFIVGFVIPAPITEQTKMFA